MFTVSVYYVACGSLHQNPIPVQNKHKPQLQAVYMKTLLLQVYQVIYFTATCTLKPYTAPAYMDAKHKLLVSLHYLLNKKFESYDISSDVS